MMKCRSVTAMTAVVLWGVALCVSAKAKPVTLQQYQHPRTAKDLIFNKTYLIGVKDALIAYDMTTQHKLFCLPGVIPKLSFDQANDIIMRWSRKAGAAPDLPVARALLFGLQEAYRCPR